MPAPTVLRTFPNHGDTGIPIGVSFQVLFDTGVDLETVKQNVVLYGPDYDQATGPDGVVWTNDATVNQDFFLTSPGFSGFVECDYSLEYWDLAADAPAVPPVPVESQADETGYGHMLTVTPKRPLAAKTKHYLHVIGDPDGVGRGISARTVFETVATSTGAGSVQLQGGYVGSITDSFVVKVTVGGDLNVAKYSFERTSGGPLTNGMQTTRFWRKLEDGVKVQFDGSGFVVGDEWVVNVAPAQYMADNYMVEFTTNDGSYSLPPDSPSTPAPSLPPATVLPGTPDEDALRVVKMTPADRSYNVSLNTRRITVEFNRDLDPLSIDNNSVSLTRLSLQKGACDTHSEAVMAKALTVEDNLLHIDF